MCLHFNTIRTNELKEKWKRDGVECIVAWKKYIVHNNKCSSYYRTDNEIDLSRNDIISNRKSKRLTQKERRWSEVHKGIHVYLEKLSRSLLPSVKIVRVLCNVEDFVGCNNPCNTSEAVFTKVFLEDGSWKDLRTDCRYRYP